MNQQNSGMITDPRVREYLRFHPKWYLILSRYPDRKNDIVDEFKIENKLTLADRIEKIGFMLQMLEMFI